MWNTFLSIKSFKCGSSSIAKAFASILHAHNVGSALYLRHIRDGVELEPLDWNDNYDFDYQQITTFEEPRTFLPGDQFVMHCEYDTTGRDGMTLAGLGSSLVEHPLCSEL